VGPPNNQAVEADRTTPAVTFTAQTNARGTLGMKITRYGMRDETWCKWIKAKARWAEIAPSN
jgi:hypothetical protein